MGNIGYDEVNVQENLEKAGLNWTVRSEGIQTVSGIEIPKTIAVIREDNDDCLGIHSSGYELYQNREMMELLNLIGQKRNIDFHSGGTFHGGGKVWVQLKASGNDSTLDLGGDKVEGYISAINSFDGSTSLAFGNLLFTISCQNSFWHGYKELGNKIRHTSSLRTRIDEVLMRLDIILKEEQNMFSKIEKMRKVTLDPAVKELVARKFFELEKFETMETALVNPEVSTRKKNMIISFQDAMNIEIPQKGQNLWGMFSSVTRFTTHNMKKDGADNSQSKMVGITGVKEREIWKELVSMV